MNCLANDNLPLVQSVAEKRGQLWVKRALDLLIAASILIALAPVMALVGFLIRLGTPGPAFFRQVRVGREGKTFTIYKFRTMLTESDSEWAAAEKEAAKRGALLKARTDPRITRFGALLRSTSFDELPQLLNVVRGEMSLVGPRPLVPFMLSPYPDFARARSLMRPGITGLWQVRNRENNTSAAGMIADDLEYIENFQLSLDLLILARTVSVVLSRRGAI
jgi:lipopolysaccharide/colanic/teichoic acid biosynthesis glycosyltransferase